MVVTVASLTLFFFFCCCEKPDTYVKFSSFPVPTFSAFLKDIESPYEVSTTLFPQNLKNLMFT